MMEGDTTIQHCLSLDPAPVSYLIPPFSVFRSIWTAVEQVPHTLSRKQLRILVQALAKLLSTLDEECQAGRLSLTDESPSLDCLIRLLEDINIFIHTQASYPFLKSLLTKDSRITQIEQYHRRIDQLVNTFQISISGSRNWRATGRVNDRARVEDQENLIRHLCDLEQDQNGLLQALNVHPNHQQHHSDVMAMMVPLHRHLEQRTGTTEQELQFFASCLQCLSVYGGLGQFEFERWMVTSFEVEFADQIGASGVGQVFRGYWNTTDVALKVLRTEWGVIPSTNTIRREIDTWSKLIHPHILQFLGANTLDGKPFIVTPFMKNGNVRDYVQSHTDCNRAKLLHDMSLGLAYLHSQKVTHGDLMARNVLIDDNQNAVLCDFALSRVRADIISRSASADLEIVAGPRNWMAPERLMGGSVKKPADIYAFGMTIYEIYTNETPLRHIQYGQFIKLVVQQDARPQRPQAPLAAPQLNDSIWQLAERCWVKDAGSRPDASALCDALAGVLG